MTIDDYFNYLKRRSALVYPHVEFREQKIGPHRSSRNVLFGNRFSIVGQLIDGDYIDIIIMTSMVPIDDVNGFYTENCGVYQRFLVDDIDATTNEAVKSHLTDLIAVIKISIYKWDKD